MVGKARIFFCLFTLTAIQICFFPAAYAQDKNKKRVVADMSAAQDKSEPGVSPSAPLSIAPPPPGANDMIALSLREAVERTLKNNTGITVAQYTPKITQQAVGQQEAVFDPTITGLFSGDRTMAQQSSAFAAPDVSTLTDINWNAGIAQKLVTGMTYQLNFVNQKIETNSQFAGLNPQFTSGLTLTLDQPFLKNFGIDINKSNIYVARNNVEESRFDFEASVITSLTTTENAYWDLVFSIENLKVQEQSLTLARDLERRVRAQVEVGTMAPLDIVTEQADVAAREELVIAAKYQIKVNEDKLRYAMNIPFSSPEGAKPIVALEKPVMPGTLRFPSQSEAVAEALTKRPDYLKLKKDIESKNILVKYNENQLYPSVDLVATLGLNGIAGGQQIINRFGTPYFSRFGGDYSTTLGNMLSSNYYNWSIGVQVSYPLGNRLAESNVTAARLTSEQLIYNIKDVENQAAVSVRDALNQIVTNGQQVEATRAAKTLAEERLKAEDKKFMVGLSTAFTVLQYQTDLATQRSNELQAIVNYNKSIALLRQVMGTTLENYHVELTSRALLPETAVK